VGTDTISASFLWGGASDQQGRRIGWTLAASVLLHLCLLVAVGGFRLPAKIERPLASYQVSLVRLPAPPAPAPPVPLAAPAEPQKQAPPPVPTQKPAVVKAPALAPPAPPPPVVVRPEPQIKDLLRGIKLPPQAPKLGDIAPAEQPAPIQQAQPSKPDAGPRKLKREIDQLLNNLTVPEAAPAAKDNPLRRPQAESLSKQLQHLEIREPKPLTEELAGKPPASQATKTPPATKMQVPGIGGGFNAYLTLVQRKISAQWIAPPVDLTAKTYKVVVRFRLDQSGSVSGVTVETPSGNEYFDIAAMRAVLKADPLPSFPKDLTEPSLDAHFSFMMGEGEGKG
jgi:TonB family protein